MGWSSHVQAQSDNQTSRKGTGCGGLRVVWAEGLSGDTRRIGAVTAASNGHSVGRQQAATADNTTGGELEGGGRREEGGGGVGGVNSTRRGRNEDKRAVKAPAELKEHRVLTQSQAPDSSTKDFQLVRTDRRRDQKGAGHKESGKRKGGAEQGAVGTEEISPPSRCPSSVWSRPHRHQRPSTGGGAISTASAAAARKRWRQSRYVEGGRGGGKGGSSGDKAGGR